MRSLIFLYHFQIFGDSDEEEGGDSLGSGSKKQSYLDDMGILTPLFPFLFLSLSLFPFLSLSLSLFLFLPLSLSSYI